MVLEMSRHHAHYSSVSADHHPREQSDDADLGDPESDRRRPRESVGEERETKRVRFNVFDGEGSDEWVEAEEEWVRIHRRPRRDLFSPYDSQGGLKLSDISKRRESVVCSTHGGERRIIDRWRDKETAQDLLQEWTGSTKFRKSWGVLSERTKPSAEGDFSRDVKGDILDFRPLPQQGTEWNLRNSKDQLKKFVADTQEVPETCHFDAASAYLFGKHSRSILMGRLPVTDVLGNHLKDRLFRLVLWLSITL